MTNIKNDCPCRGCNTRTPTCHGICPQYKKWVKINERLSKERKSQFYSNHYSFDWNGGTRR